MDMPYLIRLYRYIKNGEEIATKVFYYPDRCIICKYFVTIYVSSSQTVSVRIAMLSNPRIGAYSKVHIILVNTSISP